MGTVRLAPAARLGGPNAPANPCPDRVFTTRHGVIPTKTREFAGDWARGVGPAASLSDSLSCQYGGAVQCLRGTTLSWPCAVSASGIRTSPERARLWTLTIGYPPLAALSAQRGERNVGKFIISQGIWLGSHFPPKHERRALFYPQIIHTAGTPNE